MKSCGASGKNDRVKSPCGHAEADTDTTAHYSIVPQNIFQNNY
jgi:hypothetical protein